MDRVMKALLDGDFSGYFPEKRRLSPLEEHLLETLRMISRMEDTDPRAALLARKAIEPSRLKSVLEGG